MTASDELLVRVDASSDVGTGHAMRCLALAQGWRDDHGTVRFLMAEALPAVEERLRVEGVGITKLSVPPGSAADVNATTDLAAASKPAWVVLDGYRFGPEFQVRLKEHGCRVLAIDDYGHAVRYTADLILNQNLSARPEMYAGAAQGTRLLLGPRYLLLQRNFRKRPPRTTTEAAAHRVLVTVGGVDPHNVTLKILKALETTSLERLEVRAVVGSANPNETSLRPVAESSEGRIRLERNPPDMAALMEWADVAIASAGTTAWELAYMGVATLLFSTADNQRPVAESLAAAGGARDLGTSEALKGEYVVSELRALLKSPRARETMTTRARAVVDGRGVSRALTELKAALIALRPVGEGDARQLWEWANDTLVRSVSFSRDPISWEDHLAWFATKRADASSRFYIGFDPDGDPLGQVRFDLQGAGAEVSVSLDARFRGRGYGSALVLAGSRKVLGETGVARLDAYVKPGNEPSVHAFLNAGYQDAGRTMVRGHEALRFVLEREASR